MKAAAVRNFPARRYREPSSTRNSGLWHSLPFVRQHPPSSKSANTSNGRLCYWVMDPQGALRTGHAPAARSLTRRGPGNLRRRCTSSTPPSSASALALPSSSCTPRNVHISTWHATPAPLPQQTHTALQSPSTLAPESTRKTASATSPRVQVPGRRAPQCRKAGSALWASPCAPPALQPQQQRVVAARARSGRHAEELQRVQVDERCTCAQTPQLVPGTRQCGQGASCCTNLPRARACPLTISANRSDSFNCDGMVDSHLPPAGRPCEFPATATALRWHTKPCPSPPDPQRDHARTSTCDTLNPHAGYGVARVRAARKSSAQPLPRRNRLSLNPMHHGLHKLT